MATVYTYTVNGITWRYTLDASNNASIGNDTVTNGNATTSGASISGAITIPDTVGTENYPVTRIGVAAFYNCTGITSVTIPNTVTFIGAVAFYNTRLSTVTIPNLVTYIGSQSFMNIPGLSSVKIGKSVTTIDAEAFRILPSLTSINIPPSVTTISTVGSGVFDQTPLSLVITMNTQTINGTTYTSPTTTDISFFGNPSVTLIVPPPLTMTIASVTPGVTSGSTTNNESITLSFTSSAPTTDFIITDITVTGGTLTNLVTSNNIVYTATLTSYGSRSTVILTTTVKVTANKFTDGEGRNNTESNEFTWTYDNVWITTPLSNRLSQTYVNNFVDVNGMMVIRNNNNVIMKGNLTVDGNIITAAGSSTNFTQSMNLQSRLFTNNNVTVNGNLYLGGDLSVNGQFSSNFADGVILSDAVIFSSGGADIQGNVSIMGDVSFNGSSVELSSLTELQTTGTITFSDGSQIRSYDDNILSGSYATNNVIYKDSLFSAVTVNGNVYIGGSLYTSSDYRIKTDVATLDGSYTVDALNPVQYNNTLTCGHEYGFIAHELQEAYPDMVVGEKDGEKYQSVMYTNLIGVMVKEVQELKHRMDKLETAK